MNEFQDWIGKSFHREDVITTRLVDHFQKTFGPHFDQSQEVPPCFFWCLAPDSLPANQLGADGHPQLGIYLPNICLLYTSPSPRDMRRSRMPSSA